MSLDKTRFETLLPITQHRIVKRRTVYCISKKVKDENYDVYVGSTSQSLAERLRKHKVKVRANLPEYANNKFYNRILSVGLDAWEIKPLLVLECDRNEIRKFERKWVELLEADLNTNSPFQTEDEYNEYKKEYKKHYYEQNRDEIRQKQANYYKQNKDEVRQRQTDYYKQNKDEGRQRQKEHHKQNKEQRRFYCSTCDTACENKKDLNRHLDTLKHAYANLNSLD